jgi:hypothetical protein
MYNAWHLRISIDHRFARTKDAIRHRLPSTTSSISRNRSRQPSLNHSAHGTPDSMRLSDLFLPRLALASVLAQTALTKTSFENRLPSVRSRTHDPRVRADLSENYSPAPKGPFALRPVQEEFAGIHYSTPLINVEAKRPNHAEQGPAGSKSQASSRRRLSILHVLADIRKRAALV